MASFLSSSFFQYFSEVFRQDSILHKRKCLFLWLGFWQVRFRDFPFFVVIMAQAFLLHNAETLLQWVSQKLGATGLFLSFNYLFWRHWWVAWFWDLQSIYGRSEFWYLLSMLGWSLCSILILFWVVCWYFCLGLLFDVLLLVP